MTTRQISSSSRMMSEANRQGLLRFTEWKDNGEILDWELRDGSWQLSPKRSRRCPRCSGTGRVEVKP